MRMMAVPVIGDIDLEIKPCSVEKVFQLHSQIEQVRSRDNGSFVNRVSSSRKQR